jgi:hypothetical protein
VALRPLAVPGAGFFGLNTQKGNVPLAASWATRADNAVIDSSGRLAARQGYSRLNSSAITGTAINSLHEYVQSDGDTFVISAINNKLYSGTGTPTEITGTGTITADNWQMVNFNGSVYMWQAGHTPRSWNGTGNTAAMAPTSGTLPDGDAVVAAFGRLWAVDDDKQTIRYSGLLLPLAWDTADGGGVIDMRTVWTKGTDEVVALAAFGSSLVVFGKSHVVLWADGRGSEIGLDPLEMYVTDVIENAGCIARDSVQLIGEGDIYFLSSTGVRSLRRTQQEQASPVNDLSANIRDRLNNLVTDSGVTLSKIKSVYSPDFGFYLLSIPDKSLTLCFDTRGQLEDGSLRVTMWPGFAPTAACRRVAKDVLFGFGGHIGKYGTYLDHTSTYMFAYRSGWLGVSDSVTVILKEMLAKLFTPGAYDVSFSWLLDFTNTVRSVVRSFQLDGSAEYNVGQYGVSEYGGASLSYRRPRIPLSGQATHVMLGITTTIDGYPFAVQALSLYARPGRMD